MIADDILAATTTASSIEDAHLTANANVTSTDDTNTDFTNPTA